MTIFRRRPEGTDVEGQTEAQTHPSQDMGRQFEVQMEDGEITMQAALLKLEELGGYNLIVGGDGAARIMQNFDPVFEAKIALENGPTTIQGLTKWVIDRNNGRAPRGLLIDEPDFDLSTYTMVIPGTLLGLTVPESVIVGVYGRSLSPEAKEHGGQIIFKPTKH